MSLIDRLAGRKTNGSTPSTPASSPASDPEGSLGARLNQPRPGANVPSTAPQIGSMSQQVRSSGMYARERIEEEISAIDQLKVDLHHRLIERLDLEALEQIKDETEIVHQIRLAVGEFLREESTPLSQAEREEITEQVVWEITGLGPIEPFFRD